MARPSLSIVRGVRQRALAPTDALAFKARLAAMCRDVPGASTLLAALLVEVDRETTPSERWDFHMANPVEEARVLDLIRARAVRPMVSYAVWAEVLRNLEQGSGLVTLTREQIAARVGVAPNRVSAVLSELVAWNVLLRYTSGRSAVWRLNPNIATRLPGAAGEEARKQAGPVLRLVPRDEGGRVDDARQTELV
jgi:hypothetical protein